MIFNLLFLNICDFCGFIKLCEYVRFCFMDFLDYFIFLKGIVFEYIYLRLLLLFN